MRGANSGVQVNALNVLARALEDRSTGRLTIPTLRLAQAIAPRLDTADALDRAIGLFGFRITEHQVDNNAASPRVCVTFSETLVPAGVDYANYVRLPSAGMAVEADGYQLCVNGLLHGQRTLTSGAKPKNEDVLPAHVTHVRIWPILPQALHLHQDQHEFAFQ